MSFPTTRLRRLRRTKELRAMVRETRITVDDFIAPLFVVPGRGVKKAIVSLPDQFHFSVDSVVEEAQELKALGINAVLLFGIPPKKDEKGEVSCAEDGVVQEAVRGIKKNVPGLIVVTDLCFCEYTTHGHCGVIVDGDVHNDLTLIETKKQAISLAQAGADVIAPSGMMDGAVACIREGLDARNFHNVAIMSYSAKFASSYYGPFREAVDSAPAFGDRRTYQMDPANAREAIREIEADIAEGADIVMVKPALPYLDIIQRAKERFPVPLAAYNVSGEYAMIKAAAEKKVIDGQRVMLETLQSIKRAGADMIITYFAKEAAPLLR
jgi:porphobilinogen synthase